MDFCFSSSAARFFSWRARRSQRVSAESKTGLRAYTGRGYGRRRRKIASKNTAHGGRAAGATVTAVTALALAIAEGRSQEELALLAAVLTQPGDTLNTIAAHNDLNETER